MKPIVVAVMMSLTGVGGAIAADMPVPQAAPVPPPTYYPAYYNWSGVYLGINGGYGFGQSQWTFAGASTGNFNTNAALIGGTLGVNYQTGPFLVGFEGDIDWSNLRGNSSVAGCVGLGAAPGSTCQTNSDWLGTARARVGYAFDRVLIFGTAGGAFGNMRAVLNPPGTSIAIPTQLGWTVGAGAEYAFTEAISAKVEYLFVNLGTAGCPAAIGCAGLVTPAGSTGTLSLSESLVRGGVNYRFSW
jgi:outer membrane immunogenic protein